MENLASLSDLESLREDVRRLERAIKKMGIMLIEHEMNGGQECPVKSSSNVSKENR